MSPLTWQRCVDGLPSESPGSDLQLLLRAAEFRGGEAVNAVQ